MIIGLILAFIAGIFFGGIIAMHSAKMRSIEQALDDDFKAAQKSLEAKMKGAPANKPFTDAELAAQLEPPAFPEGTPPKP